MVPACAEPARRAFTVRVNRRLVRACHSSGFATCNPKTADGCFRRSRPTGVRWKLCAPSPPPLPSRSLPVSISHRPSTRKALCAYAWTNPHPAVRKQSSRLYGSHASKRIEAGTAAGCPIDAFTLGTLTWLLLGLAAGRSQHRELMSSALSNGVALSRISMAAWGESCESYIRRLMCRPPALHSQDCVGRSCASGRRRHHHTSLHTALDYLVRTPIPHTAHG